MLAPLVAAGRCCTVEHDGSDALSSIAGVGGALVVVQGDLRACRADGPCVRAFVSVSGNKASRGLRVQLIVAAC